MFAQFRQQYPQGSITAEIVEKVDGMHTFRAIIRSGDVVLSTAFATDRNFEQAEERAVEKALARIGLESNYDHHNYAPLLSQVTRETDSIGGEAGVLSATMLPSSKPQLQAATTVIPDERRQERHSRQERHDHRHENPAPPNYTTPNTINGEILKEIPAPSHLISESPNNYPHQPPSNHSSHSSYNSAPAAAQATNAAPNVAHQSPSQPPIPESPAPEAAGSPKTAPSPEPLDLSEAITQIDVEMQRLQWSQNDGRDYLIRTFNKKSRQRLTPQELSTFLNYLKSLPNPISASFTAESEDIF